MLPRFRHILVPLDFTAKNRTALEIAFEVVVQNSARVTLLHVIEMIGEADEEIEAFYARLHSRAESELESLAQRFADAAVDVDCKIRYGKRAREIVEHAVEHDIDLIVMSSHAVTAPQSIENWGTLSYQVAILCPCPVLLVK